MRGGRTGVTVQRRCRPGPCRERRPIRVTCYAGGTGPRTVTRSERNLGLARIVLPQVPRRADSCYSAQTRLNLMSFPRIDRVRLVLVTEAFVLSTCSFPKR